MSLPSLLDDALQRKRAIARWDNEGGAGPCGPHRGSALSEDRIAHPKMTEAELRAMHVRVIALENLVVAMLAAGSAQQKELAEEMAQYISPRPGSKRHPLTIQAAAHMNDLVQRASRFCDEDLSRSVNAGKLQSAVDK